MSEISHKGKILISNSSIVTDDFNKSVVFIIDHDSSGAFGLVVNKKSSYMMTDVVLGLPEGVKDTFMYWGGHVDHTFISILHNNPNFIDPGLQIIPGVFLSRSYDLLMKLLSSDETAYHIFHGYSGWGAGQLEAEFARKSWVIHDPTPNNIFHSDPETVWRDALKSKGGIYRYFAEHTKDPSLN